MFGTGRSIQLARIAGIRVGASPSWFIVLFALIYVLTGYFGDVVDVSNEGAFALAVAGAALFFLSIILHELGHAIVARRNGLGIIGIDLFFFGGVTRNAREAQTPGVEFRVAAAGPAVTAAIVGLCLGAGLLLSHVGEVIGVARFSDDQAAPVYALLGFVAIINIVLLAFNLVPAFPLDGGRIARAAAWRVTGDRDRGTKFSGRAGQLFSLIVAGFGLYLLIGPDPIDGLYMLVLAFFLHQAARGAVLSSALNQRIGQITVADVMDREPVTVPAETTALVADDEFFARYGWPWFAVVDAHDRFLGVLRRGAVEEAMAGGRPAVSVTELLEAEPERFRIGRDQPLSALLARPGLQEIGALAAVDAEGVLCGVVTVEQIRRALTAAAPSGL